MSEVVSKDAVVGESPKVLAVFSRDWADAGH